MKNTYIEEGKKFLQTAKSLLQSKRFDITVAQDIAAMSGEKVIVGILDTYHYMPEGHTYTELLQDLAKKMAYPDEIREKLLQLDKYQNLCSLDPQDIPPPDEQVVKNALEAIEQLLQLHEQGRSKQ